MPYPATTPQAPSTPESVIPCLVCRVCLSLKLFSDSDFNAEAQRTQRLAEENFSISSGVSSKSVSMCDRYPIGRACSPSAPLKTLPFGGGNPCDAPLLYLY